MKSFAKEVFVNGLLNLNYPFAIQNEDMDNVDLSRFSNSLTLKMDGDSIIAGNKLVNSNTEQLTDVLETVAENSDAIIVENFDAFPGHVAARLLYLSTMFMSIKPVIFIKGEESNHQMIYNHLVHV
jgi:hypothetical protein